MTSASVEAAPLEARPSVSFERPSFEAVYEAHFDFVWRTVRRFGTPLGAIDDVTQEVFMVAHRRLAEWQPTGSLRGWLFGIARRVASDHRRVAERQKRPVDPELQPVGTLQHPEESAESRQVFEMVQRFMAELDAERREIFFLAMLEELPIAEVAEALGLNPNTVYSRVRVLRRALADFLHQENQSHGGPDAP